jgi:hypothetical protein
VPLYQPIDAVVAGTGGADMRDLGREPGALIRSDVPARHGFRSHRCGTTSACPDSHPQVENHSMKIDMDCR